MIKLICVGKIKEKFYKDAINEYQKRLSKYTKLIIIELEDESSINELSKEGENILKHINNKDYCITLEIEGNMLTSEEFSKKIDKELINNSNITFIIGGSYGLSKKVKERSNYRWFFRKFPENQTICGRKISLFILS